MSGRSGRLLFRHRPLLPSVVRHERPQRRFHFNEEFHHLLDVLDRRGAFAILRKSDDLLRLSLQQEHPRGGLRKLAEVAVLLLQGGAGVASAPAAVADDELADAASVHAVAREGMPQHNGARSRRSGTWWICVRLRLSDEQKRRRRRRQKSGACAQLLEVRACR